MQPQLDPNANKLAQTIAEWIVAGGGTLATMVIVLKAVAPKIKGYYQVLKELKSVIENLPAFMETSQDLKTVSKELSTNGGSSMKDSVLRMEDMLSRLTARQHHVWKYAPTRMFHTDVNGLLIEANNALTTYLDRPNDQLLRTGWLNAIAIEKRRQCWDEWEQAIEQQRTFEIETTISVNGRISAVHIKAEPINTNSGVIGYEGVFTPLANPVQ